MIYLKPLLVSLLLFSCGMIYAQCTSLTTSIESRILESSTIVEGKVIKQQAFWGESQRIIYTSNLIEIYKVFKGTIEENTIEVITTGGRIENEALVASPSLTLGLGQTGIFMLKHYTGNKIDNSKSLILRPVADQASLIVYNVQNTSAKDLTTAYESLDDLYDEVIAYAGQEYEEKADLPQSNALKMMPVIDNVGGLSPLIANGGKSETITINGSGFGTVIGTVFFDNPDDGSGGSYSGTSSWHIISWNDSQIVTRVPSGSGSGSIFVRTSGGVNSALSNEALQINYCLTNVTDGAGDVFEPDLIDESAGVDVNGGYTFNYSTSTANNGVDITSIPAAMAAIERAADTWHLGVSMPFYVGTGCGTVTEQLPGGATSMDDGTNLISFDSDIWDLDVEASSSTLAVMYTRYSKCGASAWEVVDLDMVIRRDGGGVSWEYGPAFPSGGESDLESVVLHEFGHAVQLQHVISPGAVMHYSITTGTYNRTLGATDDLAAGSYMMTQSLAYAPPVYSCCCGGDFNQSRALSAYSVSDECAALVLPVELVAFDGEKSETGVLLSWETQVEIDNAYFTLERSVDGHDFEFLTKIEGAGTIAQQQFYDYLDRYPGQGTNYYRLWQTDYDGTTESLGVVAVDYDYSTKASLFPNPTNGAEVNLVFEALADGKLDLVLRDIAGQLIWQGEQDVVEGYQQLPLSFPKLTDGIYLLTLYQNNKTQNLRLVKH